MQISNAGRLLYISDDNDDGDWSNGHDNPDNRDGDINDDDNDNDYDDDDDDGEDEGCKLQMQSAGWQRLLHTKPGCPSSQAEGTGAAHYLKMMTMVMMKTMMRMMMMIWMSMMMITMMMVTMMMMSMMIACGQIEGYKKAKEPDFKV